MAAQKENSNSLVGKLEVEKVSLHNVLSHEFINARTKDNLTLYETRSVELLIEPKRPNTKCKATPNVYHRTELRTKTEKMSPLDYDPN